MRTAPSPARIVLLFLVLSLASTARATPQQLLTDLHHMRLAATSMVTNYYMFSGLDADAKFNRLIDGSMSRFNTAMKDALDIAANDQMADEITALETDWLKLSQLLETNRQDILTRGYPEIRLVDDMGRQGTQLVGEISEDYKLLKGKSGIKPHAVVEKARELAVLMAEMTAQYAAEGTSNLGYLFVGTGENENSLGMLADDFQGKLAQLEQLVKDQGAIILVRNIASKWRFVEDRIRNNTENSVPFLVVSYNDRILEHLEEIEASYR
ncbi:hypothetical protein ACQUQU_14625 [Thalassolituus sp. LLYu03]|uniref:hypothetical protein n=1 Tax=Thalassolituus sp. LLYu03 TaxID=3421656 RepID=UPI003D2E5E95